MNIEATGLRAIAASQDIALPARRTPVYRSVDVVVCGGGPAGVAAAVTAARGGARTLLVERHVVLGGNGPLSFDIDLGQHPEGIAAEVAARLEQAGEAGPDRMGEGRVHDPEAMKYALLDIAREAGVSFLLSTWVSDPIMRDGETRGVMVENKSGRFAVLAGIVIDATGDGELASRAGVAIATVDQPAAVQLNARIGGIDFDRALAGRPQWPALVAEAKREGRLADDQPDTIELYGVLQPERKIAFLRGPRIEGQGGRDVEGLSRAEAHLRNLMREFLPFLKGVPGFESSFLVDVAGALQLGDGRRTKASRPASAVDAEERSAVPDWLEGDVAAQLLKIGAKPAGVERLLIVER
ncbi:FAD-dependent oxidoreductase [Sphingobium lignivorans]|uniref:Glycine/D-amino acid oxidase-like deaminating enzyme n=1 Tax=Sphingobium lignivorans TaxID=2735886 RepID=A0ABR6NEY3_9SPHN|nr:FAD-dependent oxidoreductase [Sphingobium lignivorans]MBB5984789.1 glycine/D-amino acid oxidase-like deaminating enzyme [Sphingobium lignivorans]